MNLIEEIKAKAATRTYHVGKGRVVESDTKYVKLKDVLKILQPYCIIPKTEIRELKRAREALEHDCVILPKEVLAHLQPENRPHYRKGEFASYVDEGLKYFEELDKLMKGVEK